ncbi:glutamate 5-kinase [Pseudodesulfovibrio senegalensis]|uniref:Glutamate 5-kinase n=1 Tax=Pseudodesulfovibrio senegalensis TaxID=1721087 RepID=A0A6N6N4L5_9BACT|nr:glutamate 5-kinase [Pseudodesulfovibrio senegalensis]KAB1443102.1 glutamate 5-kinase [Pseudodesulfovibrio senegalensis]
MSNSRNGRAHLLQDARRIVVKVGSAVLTTQDGINRKTIIRLAGQLARLHDRGIGIVLVSSGAVAAGRTRIAETLGSSVAGAISDLPARQAASAVGQGRLMHDYDEAFGWFGKATAQILLTRDGLRDRKRFLNARNTLEQLLAWDVIPIINENDTVSVKELQFGDNDTLGAMAVGLIGADLYINLTSADGVFDKNPDKNPDAACMPLIENIAALDIDAMCDGKTASGSGGMYSKLRAARRAAQLGVPTLIVSGKNRFSLEHALDDNGPGTLVLPEDHTVSSKKFWMAYHDEPAGTITVDSGAARALTAKGKSLLPAGITTVKGCFEPGALVRICTQDDTTIGVGLTNYSSDDLNSIKGLRTSQIEALIGPVHYKEAVHRDNLLPDAAI